MIKVGVTGSIGSGKSVVCKIFECLGVPVFRADDEGRRLLREDMAIQKKVMDLFGDTVIINGHLDRKKIASIVFNDPEKLSSLNSIIHPAVRNSFANWVDSQSSKLIIEEVAILFESGANKGLDKVIVVTSDEKDRIKRAMKRDNISEDEVRQRMSRQWSQEEKASKADFVITNEHTDMLIPQVISLYKELSLKNTQ